MQLNYSMRFFPYFLIFFYTCIASQLIAQSQEQLPSDSLPSSGWDVGVELLPLFATSDAYPDYTIFLRRRSKSDWNVRTRLGFSYNGERQVIDDLTDTLFAPVILDNSLSVLISAGIEKQLLDHQNFMISWGIDVVTLLRIDQYERDYEVLPGRGFPALQFTENSTRTKISPQLQPLLLTRYRIGSRLLISLESSLQLSYSFSYLRGDHSSDARDIRDTNDQSLRGRVAPVGAVSVIFSL